MRYKTSFTLSDKTRKQISALQALLQLEQQKTVTKGDVIECFIDEAYQKKIVEKK